MKDSKNRVELIDKRLLLFRLAALWRMPVPVILDLPVSSREELRDFFRKSKTGFALSLNGLSAWVSDLNGFGEFRNRKGNVRVFVSDFVVKSKKGNDEVDNVQLFCDFFSRGGFGIDLALSLGLRTGLL